MKRSDMNHLRRLLGWVRCDIGQSPAELQQTMIDVADGLGHPDISPEAKTRMVESYRRAESIPLYVRAAVKALEKTLAAGGPDRGAEHARAAPKTRASVGFDPGADAGHESALNDVQVETGLAEIGIHAWGPRAEDWLAGAEYAARHLRGNPHSLAAERDESDASAAAEPLQSHPNAAANGVACRATPAAPPTLRRDDSGSAASARRHPAAHRVQVVQVDRATAGLPESRRPVVNLQVMQEALRVMPSDEARRVARVALASAPQGVSLERLEKDPFLAAQLWRKPADAPVAGEASSTDWQNALRIAELPEVDEALANFCDDSTLDNAVGLVLAVLGAAPQASEAVRTYRDCEDFHSNASAAELGAWQRGWDDCRASDQTGVTRDAGIAWRVRGEIRHER
ncbi:hypothetical protein [Achromobacter marplatensis]